MARPKLGEGDTHRLQLKISDEELAAIENWRYANRVPSKSEAVRRLCQMALRYDAQEPELMDALRKVADMPSGLKERWAALKQSEHPLSYSEWLKREYRDYVRQVNVLVIRAQVGRLQGAALAQGASMEEALRRANDMKRELEAEIAKMEARLQ